MSLLVDFLAEGRSCAPTFETTGARDGRSSTDLPGESSGLSSPGAEIRRTPAASLRSETAANLPAERGKQPRREKYEMKTK